MLTFTCDSYSEFDRFVHVLCYLLTCDGDDVVLIAQVMVDNPDFTPSQVGGLFTFLARQLAKPDNTLFVNRKLFDQVTHLTTARLFCVRAFCFIFNQGVSEDLA